MAAADAQQQELAQPPALGPPRRPAFEGNSRLGFLLARARKLVLLDWSVRHTKPRPIKTELKVRLTTKAKAWRCSTSHRPLRPLVEQIGFGPLVANGLAIPQTLALAVLLQVTT